LIFNACDIFFKGTRSSNIPHTYSTISPPSRGLPSTPSMLLNEITQSPILYEVNKTMDNEKEHEFRRIKSLHENVDYFQMFIPSI
jgi:hypothetical protein